MSLLNMSMAAALAHGLNAAQLRKEDELRVADASGNTLANYRQKEAKRQQMEAERHKEEAIS